MAPGKDENEVQRRLTAKGQVTLPQEVRKALGLQPGDSVSFHVAEDGTVTVYRAERFDQFFHLSLFQGLEEWSRDQRDSVFRSL